jgi:hypothetical protein
MPSLTARAPPLLPLLLLFALACPSFSYPEYLKRLPNGAQLPLVAIGHLDVSGGGQLNRFGADFVQHGTPNLPPSRNAFM